MQPAYRVRVERPMSLVPVWSSVLQRHSVTDRLGYLHEDLEDFCGVNQFFNPRLFVSK